jgi:deferrochelatase/peroxidase EfeB
MLLRGAHAVVWDGKDASGKSMPTGLYFYKFTSGSFVAVRKMLLAK